MPQVRHTIAEAARIAGKDRKTIYRHIKAGRLSCGFAADGSRYVDTSELIRVYGEIKADATPMPQASTGKMPQDETANATNMLLSELIEEVKNLREDNRNQVQQLEAIRRQMEERPLLENRVLQQAQTPRKGQHQFSSIIEKLKDSQAH